MKYNTQAGFTLLELMLVVAMIGLIAMFGASLGSGFLWRTDLSQAQYSTVVHLRYAQVLAHAAQDDSDWGVHIENNRLILFKGNDFETRDEESDEENDLGSVTVSDPIDVVYHKFSGIPYLSSSEITLTTNEETAVIQVNQEGTLTY